MAEIINLRRVRKARQREDAEARAAENRNRHGRTAAERNRDRIAAEHLARNLDGARLDPAPVPQSEGQ